MNKLAKIYVITQEKTLCILSTGAEDPDPILLIHIIFSGYRV